jgi:hypothetical protein
MAETLGHLTQLKINGYKSIKSLDLELRPLNIILVQMVLEKVTLSVSLNL